MNRTVLIAAAAVAGLVLWRRAQRPTKVGQVDSGTIRADKAVTTRAINQNTELWARLGLTPVAQSMIAGGLINIPDFGRAPIVTQRDARLFGAVLPQTESAYVDSSLMWRRAAPAVPPQYIPTLSLWNPTTTGQDPKIDGNDVAAQLPRPAMIPLSGDGQQLTGRSLFQQLATLTTGA